MKAEIVIIVAARNEESTVYEVACAAVGAAAVLGGRALVVANNCQDNTATEARRAGAMVLEFSTTSPSKAHAVQAGVAHLRAHGCVIGLVDADCRRLTTAHVLDLFAPVLSGAAAMSVGTFDYHPALLAKVVVRVPWSTGQRVLAPGVYPDGDHRLDRYNIEFAHQ